jgi:peptidoglycan/xylan/chitin deacetylase (PgdA/CDA1 family)
VRYSLPPELGPRSSCRSKPGRSGSAAASRDLRAVEVDPKPRAHRVSGPDARTCSTRRSRARRRPEYAALTWDEVRRLAGAGVEFGAHSKTHPILPLVEDEASIEEEIVGSKTRLEQELGRPAIHFCYPNGDYDDAVVEVVARRGFQTAVVVDAGLNKPPANRYLLKRLSVALYYSDDYFRELVAGMHMGLGHGSFGGRGGSAQ